MTDRTRGFPKMACAAPTVETLNMQLVSFRLLGSDHFEKGLALLLGWPIAALSESYLIALFFKHLDRSTRARRKVSDGVQVAA